MSLCWVLSSIMSLWWLSSRWVSLCWVSLCRVSLCQMSWHHVNWLILSSIFFLHFLHFFWKFFKIFFNFLLASQRGKSGYRIGIFSKKKFLFQLLLFFCNFPCHFISGINYKTTTLSRTTFSTCFFATLCLMYFWTLQEPVLYKTFYGRKLRIFVIS